jgi:hypothetical protein
VKRRFSTNDMITSTLKLAPASWQRGRSSVHYFTLVESLFMVHVAERWLMSKLRLAFIIFAMCSAVLGSTIVVPNAAKGTVGNDTDNNADVGDFRSQLLIGSGQFASVGGSLLIDQISIRASPGTGPSSITFNSLSLFLSTSSKFPNTGGPLMSTTFADNVGPDNTLVFSSGPLTLTSPGCSGPGVCPFDMSFLFTTPFLYDPTKGRLLIDLNGSIAGGVGNLDSVVFNPPNGGPEASVSGALNDTSGSLQFGGDILQLRYTLLTPEPASWILIVFGCLALCVIRRCRPQLKFPG